MAPAKNHTVKERECFSSIAYENGFFWQTLWNHPKNKALKQSRDSPFVLKVGDVVHVPALRQQDFTRPTDLRHTFRRKGVPAVLRLQLMELDEPLATLPYVASFGTQEVRGTTDAEGKVEIYLPPDTPKVTLEVGEGEDVRIYEVNPRKLEPVHQVEGLQARLANLGYYSGPINGDFDDATSAALAGFQKDQDLDPSGEADEVTITMLRDLHDNSK